MNLGQLNSNVLAALNRQKDVQAAAMLPLWRNLAEGEIFNTLRAGWMVRRGDAIFQNTVETLPPSVLQILNVSLLKVDVPAAELITLVAGDNQPLVIGDDVALMAGGAPREAGVDRYVVANLDPLAPDNFVVADYFPGNPANYLIEGFNIRLVPWPDVACRVNIVYYSSGIPLALDTDFNETLSRLPSVYVYGMLKHASTFYGDSEGEARFNERMVTAIMEANSQAYSWYGTGFQARVG
jgi:hypothetical protein